MARPLTGAIIESEGRDGRIYALRFCAYGRRRYGTLGSEGWTRQRAEQELANVLADVRRGIWRPLDVVPEHVGSVHPGRLGGCVLSKATAPRRRPGWICTVTRLSAG